MIEKPYWDVPGIKNSGKCQSAHKIPTVILPTKEPNIFWSLGCTNPLQPISSPKPSYIRKKIRKDILKDGENHFTGTSTPWRWITANVLNRVTIKGIKTAREIP